jgi:hypothetical protein
LADTKPVRVPGRRAPLDHLWAENQLIEQRRRHDLGQAAAPRLYPTVLDSRAKIQPVAGTRQCHVEETFGFFSLPGWMVIVGI